MAGQPPSDHIGSFSKSHIECGWTVTPETSSGAGNSVNEVSGQPSLFMIDRAIASFGAGVAGVGDITIGSSVSQSYSTVPCRVRLRISPAQIDRESSRPGHESTG